MMDSVILAFVALIFAVSLTFNWVTLVLCSKKINCMARKLKKLEKILGVDK